MKKILLGIVSLCLVSSSIGYAFTTSIPSEGNNQGLVSITNPVQGDLYSAGGSVQVNQKVDGDLLVGAGEIRINAPIGQDILGAGGRIHVNAPIGDDARLMGGEINIDQSIQGDLVVFGGNIIINSGVTIGGDLVIGGGAVTMAGEVKGNAIIKAGEVSMIGNIQGNADMTFESLTTASGAKIGGNLIYTSRSQNSGLQSIVSGTTDYKMDKDIKGPSKKTLRGMFAGLALYKWAYLTLFAAILVFAMRRSFMDIARVLRSKPRQSLLTGFLVYCLTPLAIIILAITVIGLPVAGAVAFLYGALLLLGGIISTAVISSWFVNRYRGGLINAPWWKILLTIIIVAGLFALISGIDIIAVFIGVGAYILYKIGLSKKYLSSPKE